MKLRQKYTVPLLFATTGIIGGGLVGEAIYSHLQDNYENRLATIAGCESGKTPLTHRRGNDGNTDFSILYCADIAVVEVQDVTTKSNALTDSTVRIDWQKTVAQMQDNKYDLVGHTSADFLGGFIGLMSLGQIGLIVNDKKYPDEKWAGIPF